MRSLVAQRAIERAQSFVGVGPVRSFVLPTEPRGEPQAVPASVIVTPAPLPRAEASAIDGLRRLPATLRGFRFDGEWAQAEWPVYLTTAQARQAATFELAFLSAISVMPEGSRMTLAVNDTVIAQTGLAAPDALAPGGRAPVGGQIDGTEVAAAIGSAHFLDSSWCRGVGVVAVDGRGDGRSGLKRAQPVQRARNAA